ncbi:T9SS type A sorting domain-containing protein [Aequorivita sp. H23M31]|uniref:T9SS type A sorting domain-containing protein n=1 Tax=Aequorivita ciconiae TaxID=2494375 RepID=A0A410G7Q0_9FLAO|nr:T9SS type A sorting domain-containing protein [Aequorivita sp. H23M31]
MYPNPTSNENFSLKITSTTTDNLSLEFVDIIGKKIYTENGLKEYNVITVLNIFEGICFVKLLKNGKMIAFHKLVNVFFKQIWAKPHKRSTV